MPDKLYGKAKETPIGRRRGPPAKSVGKPDAANPVVRFDIDTNASVFLFRSAAFNPPTERDVIMCYEFFFGRNPETAFVIADKKSLGFPAMIAALMRSDEFTDKVVRPLRSGRPVDRGDYRKRPSAEQLEWLMGLVEFTVEQEKALNEAANWSEYFRALCAIGGIDVSPEGSSADAPASRAVGVEQPRGELDSIVALLEKIRALLKEVEESVRALPNQTKRAR
jgi:hypothetical protein